MTNKTLRPAPTDVIFDEIARLEKGSRTMPDNILSGIFAVVGAAIGGLFGYGSAIAAAVRKERNQAAIDFQSAFYPTLAIIDPIVGLGINDHSFKGLNLVGILEGHFPTHVMAYQKFRQYLPSEKRIEFDTARGEYCHHKAENGRIYVYLAKYFNPAAYADHSKERDEAVKNIRNLLSFAQLDHKSPFEPAEDR